MFSRSRALLNELEELSSAVKEIRQTLALVGDRISALQEHLAGTEAQVVKDNADMLSRIIANHKDMWDLVVQLDAGSNQLVCAQATEVVDRVAMSLSSNLAQQIEDVRADLADTRQELLSRLVK